MTAHYLDSWACQLQQLNGSPHHQLPPAHLPHPSSKDRVGTAVFAVACGLLLAASNRSSSVLTPTSDGPPTMRDSEDDPLASFSAPARKTRCSFVIFVRHIGHLPEAFKTSLRQAPQPPDDRRNDQKIGLLVETHSTYRYDWRQF